MNQPDKTQIIKNTEEYVRETLGKEGTGHDWWHVNRVRNTALTIALEEKVDAFVVELAALLHDIADHKFHNGDHTVGPRVAREWLSKQGIDSEAIEKVVDVVANVSYSKEVSSPVMGKLKELQIVQDADRLDAIGAIGIARAFAFGGYKDRLLYNPESAEDGSTVQHFYDKLLKLKDLMNTKAGKKMAEERHKYMEQYLERFYEEWRGEK